MAAHTGHASLHMLQAGADPGAANAQGLTPLCAAASGGRTLCVGLLLKALAAAAGSSSSGGDGSSSSNSSTSGGSSVAGGVQHTDVHGNSALHYAARAGQVACVAALLAAGAGPGATTWYAGYL